MSLITPTDIVDAPGEHGHHRLTLLHGGRVISCDAGDAVHAAVAIEGQKIRAVGRDEDILALDDGRCRVIDLGGRVVIPGMTDGHAHLDREGLRQALPSLQGARCIADVLAVVADAVRLARPGEWIVTQPLGSPPEYVDPASSLEEGRYPDRFDLDRVSPRNPVHIRPIWGYWRNKPPLVSVFNTAALRLAGIDRHTRSPSPDVEIVRDAQGEPTGVFIDHTLRPIVEHSLMRVAPDFSAAERVAGLRHAMAVYNRFGTTAVYEGHGVASEVVDAYGAIRREGASSVRATLAFSPHWGLRAIGEEALQELKAWSRWLSGRGRGDALLRIQGLYAELDTEPLNNRLRAGRHPCTGWAGFQATAALPADALDALLGEAARQGIRVSGIFADMLPAFARADKVAPIAGQRWVLGHQPVLTPAMIDQIQDLGVSITTHTNRHIFKDGDAWQERRGPAGESDIVPLRRLLDRRIPVSFGTDNLPVTLFHPVSHASLRRSRSGALVAPDQAITRQEALRIATCGGAHLTFDEEVRGSIEPGRLADLVVLDRDPITCAAQELPTIESLLTIVDGRIVHTHPSFAPRRP